MVNVTVYVSPHCDACRAWLPTIKRNAEKRGEKVVIRDIEKCRDEACKSLEVVPSIVRDGRVLSEKEMNTYYER